MSKCNAKKMEKIILSETDNHRYFGKNLLCETGITEIRNIDMETKIVEYLDEFNIEHKIIAKKAA